MASGGQEPHGDGAIRLRAAEFDLLRQAVREIRELGDGQLTALGVQRGDVDDLGVAVRTAHRELADADYIALAGGLAQAAATWLPAAIRYVGDWLGESELRHRTGNDLAQLDDLVTRLSTSHAR